MIIVSESSLADFGESGSRKSEVDQVASIIEMNMNYDTFYIYLILYVNDDISG